ATDAAGVPDRPSSRVPEPLRPWDQPPKLIGWAVAVVMVAIAALTRVWALGSPKGNIFDEVYYHTESEELLRFGYEDNRGFRFIVHPPLGKWLIAIPQWIINNHAEFGYRLGPAIAGIVSVLLITRIARRMFRSDVFGAIAGLLLALDGMSIVQSRVALLDIFLQLFIIAAFGALLLDRDQARGRLARLLADGADLGDGVPGLGPRPWRLAGGVLLALANAVKWSALPFFIGFLILSLWWDRGALKSAGVRHSWRGAARRSWLGAIWSLLVAPIGAYLLCWLGWFAGENSWNRHWADTHSTKARLTVPFTHWHFSIHWGFVPSPIRSLGAYHLDAYRFHDTLTTTEFPHPYMSNPWSWLVLGRPVDYYYWCTPAGKGGCDTAGKVQHILLIGTPLMWWAFAPVMVWLAWHWFTTHDWRAAAVWVAFIAGWAFWLRYPTRTMFLFYLTPLVPFLIMGVTLALGALLGPAVRAADLDPDERAAALRRRGWGALGVAAYLGLVVIDFAWMWPIFTGRALGYHLWNLHMWFQSWI
ncbi:MAG: phospholipid carrier-dependent glycosyltransferase, partial [Actinomycetia bacterium]|nr:phospholipid carrier-dependent glycosyltransferase [Actinomycetes bacterium]